MYNWRGKLFGTSRREGTLRYNKVVVFQSSMAGAGRDLDRPISDLGFTAKEIADRLVLSDKTIKRWRKNGKGPPFVRYGKIYYYPDHEYFAWVSEVYSKMKPISFFHPAEEAQGAAE